MTLYDMAFELWEGVRKNIVDDDELDLRWIKQLIVDQREISISNAINKGSNSKDGAQYGTGSGYDGGWENFSQTITVPLSLESYISSGADCYTNNLFWKSDSEVPDVLMRGRRPAVLRVIVNSPDLYAYKPTALFSSYDRALYAGNGRFNSSQLVSFLKNDYLFLGLKYTDTPPTITSAEVELILRDPTEAPGYNDEVDDFPVGKLWPYIKGEVEKIIRRKIQSTEDIINNADND